MVWARPAVAADGADHTVMSYRDRTESGFSLDQTADGHWRFCLARSLSTPAYDCVTSSASVAADQWTMLTGEWNYDTGRVTLYLNANYDTDGAHTVQPSLTQGTIVLGNLRTSGAETNYFSGDIGDSVVYNDLVFSTGLNDLRRQTLPFS